MSISDLEDDGSFEWLYRGEYASSAIDLATQRARLDSFDKDAGWHKSMPMQRPDGDRVNLAFVELGFHVLDDRTDDRLGSIYDLALAAKALMDRVS